MRKPGDKIICNHCDMPIFELLTEVKPLELIKSTHFKNLLTGKNPKSSEKIICPNCGGNFEEAFREFCGWYGK